MSRLLTKLNPADRVVLVFTVFQTVYGLLTGSDSGRIAFIAGGNFIIFAAVLLIVYFHDRSNGYFLSVLHRFYPILLNIWFYPRSCELRFGIFSDSFDPFLVRLDQLLFRQDWSRLLPETMNTGFLEFFHAVYFLYYLALVILPWTVLKKHSYHVAVYVYTLTVTMAVHHVFIMLFPASGPVYLRGELLPEGWIFIPAMNWIYQNLDSGGGAFPSLHVAAAMVLFYFSRNFFPRLQPVMALFTLSVLVSTVADAFHYPVDVTAGIVTGTLFYLFIPGTYNRLLRSPDHG